MSRTKNEFQTIHSEGGLLPPDLLRRVVDPKANLPGTKPEDYGLPQGERINETITQSWNRLRRHWAEFRASAKNLPAGEAGTGLTNDKWSVPLLRELGFGLLPTTPGPEVGGRTYAINRFSGRTAIHLVGCGLSLDRRAAGVRGAAATNPHGLVQEFLNRSPGHLWAIVSNGLRFRILRDNQALSRQSYLEFDLEAMLAGEVFSDFVLLWLMAHATRFASQTESRPETCWLEQWTKVADEEGTRALGDLRAGVEQALQILGEAFVSHPRNTPLREALRMGKVPLADFHGQLLRLVYRLIFLFVAEDRTLDGISLLHPPDDSEAGRQARDRYDANYSMARQRELAAKIKGSRHGDLWHQFNLLVGALSGDARFATARQQLALPVLGSFLWSPESTSALNAASLSGGEGVELANADFLEALRHLAYTRQGNVLRPVDYRNLGAEELGGVYESLLALTPQISGDGNRFTFAEFAGNERKTSGSYYTPDSLVQCLLDSALDPVVEEALKGKSGSEAEKALLSLKVCDPAVGSGHFLVGAAHRLARHLARVRANAQGESEPSPLLYQHALRDVIGRCLYGVDINPMAAELCRVGLWLEALEPGKPLSFLDHHIQVGNSLLGTTPALLAAGIPDEAFTAIEGDIKAKCAELKRDNKRERQEYKSGQGYLFEPPIKLGNLASEFAQLSEAPDDTPEAVAETSRRYAELVRGTSYQFGRLLADTWCAAFVWKKDNSDLGKLCPTERTFRKVESHAGTGLIPHVRAEVERLRDQYQFFHWHLAFPDVFRLPSDAELPDNEQCGWCGGFDAVLGNPPWDTLSPDQREFFGNWVSGLRSMAPENQQTEIDRLLADEAIAKNWAAHCRDLFAFVHFLKHSGVFTLYAPGNLGKGDFNVYRMFVETAMRRSRLGGFGAMIVPGGLYGGANASAIRKHLLDECELRRLFGLINTQRAWFEKVDIDRFAAFAAKRGGYTGKFLVQFGLASPADLSIQPVEMDADVIRRLSPDTYAIPDLRNFSELSTNRKMYAACPPFGVTSLGVPIRHYCRELDMGTDRALFTTDPSGLAVYEGRMIDHFDHRAKTYESGHGNSAVWIEREFGDPAKAIVPQWRVLRENIPSKLGDRCDHFRIGFGDVANPRNERSFTATIIPPGTICGDKVPTLDFGPDHDWFFLPWLAVANSFAMDWLARTRLTAPKMAFSLLDGLPFPRPGITDELVQRVSPTVLRLICTATEMTPFWNRMAKIGFVEPVEEGAAPPTAIVDPSARAIARAELDALIAAQVFNLTAQELAELLDTFGVLIRREQRTYGEFRTKRLILKAFENLTTCCMRPVEASTA